MLRIISEKKFITIIFTIILVATLWVSRVIPSGICILTASRYINEKYPDRHFKYSFIEYFSADYGGKYFVHFKDREGKDINLVTSLFGVDYDPLDPPG